jgi:hypothetical protein
MSLLQHPSVEHVALNTLRTSPRRLIIQSPQLDLTVTGFEIGKIDRVVFADAEGQGSNAEAERILEIPAGSPVTRLRGSVAGR